MKKFFIFLLVFIFFIGIVNAQEAPKYNFGSMQSAKELNIAPGETAETKLYFYNIYGNRITHVTLDVGEAPEKWDINFEPALHKTKVKISGVLTTVEENLYVRPSETVEEIPEDIPEGIEYISSSVGYIGAKPVKVKITVPKDEKFGEYKVTINALANWLGQGGGVAFNQARSFEYTITVTSKEFTEEVLEKPKLREAEELEKLEEAEELEKPRLEQEKPEEVVSEVKEKIPAKEVKVEKGISPAVFYGTVIALVMIILILLVFSAKGKKKKKKKR